MNETHQKNNLTKEKNFWTEDGYMETIQRAKNGYQMCNFLIDLVKERAQMEENYAKCLHKWYLKWVKKIDKSTEYGTNKNMLKQCVGEGERLSDIHTSTKNDIHNLVISKIKNYRKENYSYQICGSKPASTYKKAFEKAKKPWEKKLLKISTLESEFNLSTQKVNETMSKENSINKNNSQEYNHWKEEYQLSLREMDNAKERLDRAKLESETIKKNYITDMNNVFANSQNFEMKRLEFFKEILQKFQKVLQNSKSSNQVSEIYESSMNIILTSDPKKDTTDWASQHGPSSQFVDYVTNTVNENLIQKIEQKRQEVAMETPKTIVPMVTVPNVENNVMKVVKKNDINNNNRIESFAQNEGVDLGSEFDEDSFESKTTIAGKLEKMAGSQSNMVQNKTKMASLRTSTGPISDYGGVYSTLDENQINRKQEEVSDNKVFVKALFDYKSTAGDELSLKEGEIFEMLKTKDDKGWSVGRKEGKVGIFPGDYVQVY